MKKNTYIQLSTNKEQNWHNLCTLYNINTTKNRPVNVTTTRDPVLNSMLLVQRSHAFNIGFAYRSDIHKAYMTYM